MDALLLGEMAFQRGRLDVAVQQYEYAARYTRDPKIAERATHIAFYAGQDKVALEMAHIWEQADPGNPDIPQVLALLTLRNGDVQASLGYWRRILKAKGHTPEQIFGQMSRVLAGEKNKAAVMQLMDALMKEYGNLPEAQLSYARLAIEAKEYATAESAMNRALKLHPRWWQVYVLQAHLYIQQGDMHKAEQAMAEAIKAKPKDVELRLRYARMLFQEGKYQAAKQQFQVLIKLRPNDADVRFALGILHLQLEEYDQARRQFRYLVSHGQRVDDASYYLGSLAEQAGHLNEAKRWYSRVRHGENVYHAVRRLVFIMARQEGLETALDYLHQLSSESGSDAIRLLLLEGEVLTETRHYQRAFQHYGRALEEYPDSFDLRYSRAMVAEKLDKLDVLEEDLRTILKNNPKNADALNALGYTLADRTDRLDEAYKMIKQALALKPNDGPIMDSMGWVLYKMGRKREAVGYLERAYRILHDTEVAAHLGEVYWSLGEKVKARRIWQAAAKRDPNNEVLKRTMERFLK
jgi:tetratricopeptide (TPR) repeat protein